MTDLAVPDAMVKAALSVLVERLRGDWTIWEDDVRAALIAALRASRPEPAVDAVETLQKLGGEFGCPPGIRVADYLRLRLKQAARVAQAAAAAMGDADEDHSDGYVIQPDLARDLNDALDAWEITGDEVAALPRPAADEWAVERAAEAMFLLPPPNPGKGSALLFAEQPAVIREVWLSRARAALAAAQETGR